MISCIKARLKQAGVWLLSLFSGVMLVAGYSPATQNILDKAVNLQQFKEAKGIEIKNGDLYLTPNQLNIKKKSDE